TALDGGVEPAAGIARSEYRFSIQADRTWSAPNRAHDLRARFDASGLEVTSRTLGGSDTPRGWSLRLELTRVGRTGHETGVSRARVEQFGVETAPDGLAEGRLSIPHGDLTEWYVNNDTGLEQGFVIQAPPPRSEALDESAD